MTLKPISEIAAPAPTTIPISEMSVEQLAKSIKDKIALMLGSFKTSVERAMEIGDLLIAAKERVGHGNFEAWVTEHCAVSYRSARRYVTERIAAVLDRLEAQQQIAPLDSGVRALELLQMIYRGEYKATAQQMRAAIESLPYEQPKLMAVAHISGSFAEQLDKAIEARSMKLIEQKPSPTPTEQQLPPDVLKKPMSKLRRF